MLKESYLANMRNLPKDAVKIVVTRSAGHMLSPSRALLFGYKSGKVDWAEYVKTFTREMDNPACVAIMREIKKIAKTRDLYLICYEAPGKNCHRYLLMDMINKLDCNDGDDGNDDNGNNSIDGNNSIGDNNEKNIDRQLRK